MMCLLYRLMLTECGRGRRNLQRLQIVFSSWASHLARVHVVVDAVTISSAIQTWKTGSVVCN